MDISDFSKKLEDSVKVVFHAVLPYTAWKWDKDSEVYIRFGHKNLGNWKHDCGPLKITRYIVLQLQTIHVCYMLMICSS